MNLILFDEPFESVRLPARDERVRHLRKVLRATVGSLVFVGFVNGLRARAEVVAVSQDGDYELKLVATEPAPALLPINLLIGLPRPHTARRILFEAASLGVASMHFFQADHSEPSYAKSGLWKTDEWRDRVLRGVEQGFGTCLPRVELHANIHLAMAALSELSAKITLDNYEAVRSLSAVSVGESNSVSIAVGPERGWSSAERAVFCENNWQPAHMGSHVLRVETACIASVAVMASRLNEWQAPTGTHLA